MFSARLRRQFIKFSISEGFFWQITVMTIAPGSAYFIEMLRMMGAGDAHYTLLTVFIQSFALMQIISAIILRKVSNLKIMTMLTFSISRMIMISFILIIIFAPPEAMLTLVFIAVGLYAVFFGIGSNAHISWIQDRVPKTFLGRFFAYREMSIKIAVLTVGFIVAIFFDLFRNAEKGFNPYIRDLVTVPEFFNMNNQKIALVIVFGLGIIAGLISIYYLSKQPESSYRTKNTQKLGKYLTEPLKNKQSRKLWFFFLYWSSMAFIGSPFWLPFMLGDLNMSFIGIQLYGAISTVGCVLIVRKIGKMIDRFGPFTAFRIAIILGFVNPFFFVFATADTSWIIFIEAVTSGISWGIVAISSFNMMLVNSPKNNKEIYLAVFAIAPAIGAIIASSMSYPVIKIADSLVLSYSSYRVVFALTGIMRLSALIPLILLFRHKSVNLPINNNNSYK